MNHWPQAHYIRRPSLYLPVLRNRRQYLEERKMETRRIIDELYESQDRIHEFNITHAGNGCMRHALTTILDH